MTSQSPRIYIYKITFEEVPYYYYGIHKEKRYNEYYMGSPKTHKWCWELYTPKKQILEIFEFNDDGWKEAREVEKRLIKPFFNTDKWCLNESCGGILSIEQARISGKKSGLSHKQNGTGFFKLTENEKSEIGKKYGKIGGSKTKELGVGIFSLTPEEKSEVSRRSGNKLKELGLGLFSRTTEQISEDSRKGGSKTYIEGKGAFSITSDQRIEINAKIDEKLRNEGRGIYSLTDERRKEMGKKTTSQVWECTITGHRSTPCGLSNFQKKRGIDTSNRKRIS